MKPFFVITAILSIFIIYSCEQANTTKECHIGSGNIVSDTINTEEYFNVLMEGKGNIFVSQGTKLQTVIELDDNLFDYLNIYTKSLQLNITPVEFICPTRLNIYLTMPSLESIKLRGAGTIQNQTPLESMQIEALIQGNGDVLLYDVHSEYFISRIAGSGSINASGSSDLCSAEINGNGNISLENFAVREASCIIEGNGDVRISASESLIVRITGNGNVYYKGNPAKFDVKINGTGVIKQIP